MDNQVSNKRNSPDESDEHDEPMIVKKHSTKEVDDIPPWESLQMAKMYTLGYVSAAKIYEELLKNSKTAAKTALVMFLDAGEPTPGDLLALMYGPHGIHATMGFELTLQGDTYGRIPRLAKALKRLNMSEMSTESIAYLVKSLARYTGPSEEYDSFNTNSHDLKSLKECVHEFTKASPHESFDNTLFELTKTIEDLVHALESDDVVLVAAVENGFMTWIEGYNKLIGDHIWYSSMMFGALLNDKDDKDKKTLLDEVIRETTGGENGINSIRGLVKYCCKNEKIRKSFGDDDESMIADDDDIYDWMVEADMEGLRMGVVALSIVPAELDESSLECLIVATSTLLVKQKKRDDDMLRKFVNDGKKIIDALSVLDVNKLLSDKIAALSVSLQSITNSDSWYNDVHDDSEDPDDDDSDDV